MTTNQQSRDKFLTEHPQIMNSCWHEFGKMRIEKSKIFVECKTCRIRIGFYESLEYSNPDYSKDFMKLWLVCREKEWWVGFLIKNNCLYYDGVHYRIKDNIIGLIDDKGTFADSVARYHGWKEGL